MNWVDYQLVKVRQEKLLEQAAHDRLARIAAENQPPIQVYAPTLARLGGLLVIWGTILQTRYSK